MQEIITVNQQEAYERGKYDFNFFAAIMAPDLYEFEFPPYFLAIFLLLTRSGDSEDVLNRIMRFALGLPRGFAKSTFMKLLVCWMIVYDKLSFILIVCANEDLAESFMSDVSYMLGSPNAEAVYGAWTAKLKIDNKQKKRITYHGREVILKAIGAKSSIRGVNESNKRPDFILCDDVQTREVAQSETESIHLRKWLVGTLFKTIAPRGTFRLIVFLGNMYPENSILKQLSEMSKWTSLVTGAILENGESLWPQLHSLEDLLDSYEHDEAIGEADIWMAEVMNDPASSVSGLLPGTLPDCPYPVGTQPDGAFVTIDPAGFKKTADDNVIVGHYIINHDGVVVEMEGGNFDPEEVIRRAVDMAVRIGAPVIGIEGGGYQQTLQFWMNKALEDNPALNYIEVVELPTGNQSKLIRIQAFIGELLSNNYYFQRPEDRATFTWFAKRYKKHKKDNRDDYLDAPAYGITMRQKYWNLISRQTPSAPTDGAPTVVSNNTPF